jgi:transcriptional regulator with XRE-family HTH domain
VVNATALKTALIRANVSQIELARRLGRSRSMVSAWVTDDQVPAEWVPLVYEALQLPAPPAPKADVVEKPVDVVEAAIRADPLLTADDKENLLALLTAIRRRRAGP